MSVGFEASYLIYEWKREMVTEGEKERGSMALIAAMLLFAGAVMASVVA